jgi:hypothetical protein
MNGVEHLNASANAFEIASTEVVNLLADKNPLIVGDRRREFTFTGWLLEGYEGLFSQNLSLTLSPPHLENLNLWICYNSPSDPSALLFQSVLDRTKIRIRAGSGTIDRDLRTPPFSTGLLLSGRYGAPWYSAMISASDSDTPTYMGVKSEISFPMFYSPHNQDQDGNHWGDVPVVVVDMTMAGAFAKDVLIDGKVRWTYTAGQPRGPWLHFNILTGEVLAFP